MVWRNLEESGSYSFLPYSMSIVLAKISFIQVSTWARKRLRKTLVIYISTFII